MQTMLQGYTPLMLFVLLCLLALLIMFYRTLRGLDELLARLRSERENMGEQLFTMNLRLEDLVRIQSESARTLRLLSGEPIASRPAEPSPEPSSKPASGKDKKDDEEHHNITDYIQMDE